MTAPVITALGAATVNRKYVYEFNTGTVGAPVWSFLEGIINSQFQPDAPNWVGDTDQAGQGFESSTKTGATWSGSLTVVRKVAGTDPTVYGTTQEFLRLKSIGKFGPQNTVQARVSEYDPNDPTGIATPRVEAYTGFCGVSWVPAGGDMLAEDNVAITLTGQGKLLTITHPYPKTAPTIPVITTIAPTALLAAGGQLVIIRGTGFTGAVAVTGVKFAGTNANAFTVQDDTEIVAISPAHAAGTGQVVITNAVGASTTGPAVTYS